MKRFKVAIAGNPNSGKTSIFNALVGANRHVGNYPGVTVEKVSGIFEHRGCEIEVVDLPGIYSLSAHSLDEKIARDFILLEKPDLIVNVIDESNLQRNLYLTAHLVEMDIRRVYALNMSDLSLKSGQELDLEILSQRLGGEVVETVGHRGQGIDRLKDAIVQSFSKEISHIKIDYDSKINDPADDTLIIQHRLGFAAGLYREAVIKKAFLTDRITESIDDVLTHRFFGIPIFIFITYLLFHLTFSLGEFPMNWIENGLHHLSSAIISIWPQNFAPDLQSLIIDGVISGVGGVIVFLPNIILLFLGLSFLEESGYMPRAAFIIDKLMHKIGLHGKSFLPMMIGFGCTVPAIMATRTLENKRDRLMTMLVLPLFSCGARLPIYMLIIPAFFPVEWRGRILWLIYAFGILTAVILLKLIHLTVFKGESTPFVMELPPYRLPTIRGLIFHVIFRTKLYLKKAATIILAISIVMWFLTSYPKVPPTIEQSSLEYSYAGRIGKAIEPAFKPIGFDWKIVTAFLGSVPAKEVFVAQMGIVHSFDRASQHSTLREKLQKEYSPLTGICILLFALIATPCSATCAATKRESGSWKFAVLQFFGLTALAYLFSLIVYQFGTMF